ncbi:30S ribosomal protein S15 [Coelomomyces lativittatus]|nr:30S ribosomal protein S15 [Coelomomyces lativittatus]KAJ1509759.1 30S ribosomal protein S15 [Coelomomyces lativittatus]KAJ1514634.1 30S ribosomal protein S15 [Coelomomyces lativittatus]
MSHLAITTKSKLNSSSSSSSSSLSLVKNVAPYLFKSNHEPPCPPPSEQAPSFFMTSGPMEHQMQYGLSPAERYFVFQMIPKAFLNQKYVAHGEKTKNLGSLIQTSTYLYSSPINSDTKALSIHQNPLKLNLATKKDRLNELNERIEMMKKILSLNSANEKRIQKWNIQRTIELFQRKPNDTGSSEVQAAILTNRINHLNEHLSTHRKDHKSRRDLFILEGKRKRHLKYLKRQDLKRYCETINALGLKDIDA